MLKVRVQGTRNDIRWFLKVLEKDDRYDVLDTSDIMSILRCRGKTRQTSCNQVNIMIIYKCAGNRVIYEHL